MPWSRKNYHLYGLTIFMFYVQSFQERPPIDVYWNSSNPMFNTDNNDHIIQVRMQDKVNINCPYYPPSAPVPNTNWEYYTIYRVNRDQYDGCTLNISNIETILVINCSEPNNIYNFATFYIESFLPTPNAQQFDSGKTYYYITTSIGTRDQISHRYQGACSTKNMKMKIVVCCDPSIRTPECINSAAHYKCPVSSTTTSAQQTHVSTESTTRKAVTTKTTKKPVVTAKTQTTKSISTTTKQISVSKSEPKVGSGVQRTYSTVWLLCISIVTLTLILPT